MVKYITYQQLKIARGVLNLGVRDIGALLKINKSTVSNAEQGKTRDFFHKNSATLIDFFKKNNIIFPTEYSIRYDQLINNQNNTSSTSSNITRFQLKSARLLLSLSQQALSNQLGITEGVIVRLELLPNNTYINPKNTLIVNKLHELFKSHGVEFSDGLYVFFKKYMDSTKDE